MPSRRRYLGLLGGVAAVGSLGVTHIQQSSPDSVAFSRRWGDPGGNAFAASSGSPNRDIELSWRRSFDARPFTVVGPNGNLFLLFDNGKILSLNTSGQSYQMSLINRMPGAITGALVHSGTLYVVDEENTMAAFTIENGDRQWQRTHTETLGEPVFANGSLYYPTEAPSVLRVDPESGSRGQERTVPSSIRESAGSQPPQLVTDNHEQPETPFVYASVPGAGLVGYETGSQSPTWVNQVDSHHRRTIFADGTLYTTSDSHISRIDARSGQVVWDRQREIPSAQVAAVSSNAVVVWSDEIVLAVSPDDGSLQWESGLQAPFSRAVITSPDTVYVLKESDPAEVIGLNQSDGLERWRYPFCTSGQLRSPALTDEFLLVPHDNIVYAFSNESDPMQRPPQNGTQSTAQ